MFLLLNWAVLNGSFYFGLQAVQVHQNLNVYRPHLVGIYYLNFNHIYFLCTSKILKGGRPVCWQLKRQMFDREGKREAERGKSQKCAKEPTFHMSWRSEGEEGRVCCSPSCGCAKKAVRGRLVPMWEQEGFDWIAQGDLLCSCKHQQDGPFQQQFSTRTHAPQCPRVDGDGLALWF